MNITQRSHNSIIAEIHHIREQLAEQYHNDLHAYSQAAESHCRALGFDILESPRQGVQVNPNTLNLNAESNNS
ncbi:hypothetical protein [Trichothermofontia sp.]